MNQYVAPKNSGSAITANQLLFCGQGFGVIPEGVDVKMLAKTICQRTVGTAAILILAIVFHPTMASATPTGFDLGGAAAYVILYQGGNPGAQLSINNFGTT